MRTLTTEEALIVEAMMDNSFVPVSVSNAEEYFNNAEYYIEQAIIHCGIHNPLKLADQLAQENILEWVSRDEGIVKFKQDVFEKLVSHYKQGDYSVYDFAI